MARSGSVAKVLPEGSDPIVGALADGTYGLLISRVQAVGSQMLCDPLTGLPTVAPDLSKIRPEDGFYIEVTYPDGWKREHQAVDVKGMEVSIIKNLKARFGVTATLVTLPDVAEGNIISVEVKNGTQS